MEDFNAVLSPSIDRNNNSQLQISETEIFLFLTSRELIDCYRTLYPESSNFIWQRDNSSAESYIDTIWMSEKWGEKIKSCYIDNLNLITESDHKLVELKIKRN
ncbi:2918_t:CDS:1 [Diversispora eburnea]|uniref:2918_t:CDS:1 n=1 Tax=Diversispora eburnea TaxID=1213867 RepID=A0A9N9C380_9GLOM|nr:2918_t:CDS:1 [Diversispora eburnea]